MSLRDGDIQPAVDDIQPAVDGVRALREWDWGNDGGSQPSPYRSSAPPIAEPRYDCPSGQVVMLAGRAVMSGGAALWGAGENEIPAG